MKTKILYKTPEISVRSLELEGFVCASPVRLFLQVDSWDSSPVEDISIDDNELVLN